MRGPRIVTSIVAFVELVHRQRREAGIVDRRGDRAVHRLLHEVGAARGQVAHAAAQRAGDAQGHEDRRGPREITARLHRRAGLAPLQKRPDRLPRHTGECVQAGVRHRHRGSYSTERPMWRTTKSSVSSTSQ